MNDFVAFENVTKKFGALTAVNNVSCSIKKGEFFSLLGPSGCGKTTLLRILAGFETPDSGRVWINGEDVTELAPNLRRVHTVFQNYALFPHMTLRQNVGFSLSIAGKPRAEINKRVDTLLELVRMTNHANKYPTQISGGQKQRIAIARALADQPQVLLLDEPLAALDLKLRQHMLLELDSIHDEVGITFVYVTHDQSEAMSLSDRIAVMEGGIIAQIDPPVKVYEAPCSDFVAEFIGDTNFFHGTVKSVDGDYCILDIPELPPVRIFNDKRIASGNPVNLSIRPEKMRVASAEPDPADPDYTQGPNGDFMPRKFAEGIEKHEFNVLRGKLESIVYLGNHTRYWIRVGDRRLSTYKPNTRFSIDRPLKWGEEVFVGWHVDDGFMIDKFTPPS